MRTWTEDDFPPCMTAAQRREAVVAYNEPVHVGYDVEDEDQYEWGWGLPHFPTNTQE